MTWNTKGIVIGLGFTHIYGTYCVPDGHDLLAPRPKPIANIVNLYTT